jgi:hypothetical protein
MKYIKLFENFSNEDDNIIHYKGYKIVIWSFRNEELDKNKSWGYQIFKNDDYIMVTKGTAGNFYKCENDAKSTIDRIYIKNNETL